jgi:uncharacterized membrane protein YdbT with pleckstrin-like domain
MAEEQPSVSTSRRDLILPGEEIVTVIRKHLIGLILIYLGVLLAVAAIVAFVVIVGPDLFQKNVNYNDFTVLALFAAFVLAFVLFIATYIYRESRIIVTSASVVQILQKGLFVRKVSRLSMADVEDVSAQQSGILPSLFNYGTLIIQTAGEMENFIFPYCPDPNAHAEDILEARQRFQEEDNA